MISVIVPVYNVEKYIENCLKSIVNQDYADFELLLVNDGSTDNTTNVIKNYLSNSKINWRIINKENGGQSSAKNLGFKQSKGDYVVFMDSDDVVTNDFLSSLYKKFNEHVDFVFCNYRYVKEQSIDNDECKEIIILNKDELIDKFLRRKINFVLPSMMFRRSFIEKNNITSNENIRFSEDQMFIWDAILHSTKSIYINKTMYGYYLREKSIMTNSPYEKIIKGYEEFVKFSNRIKQEHPDISNKIDMIVPRWSLGAIYSGANLLNKNEFISLYNIMDTRNVLWRIIRIKDLNSYLLAFVAWLSPDILYWLCRKLDLNE